MVLSGHARLTILQRYAYLVSGYMAGATNHLKYTTPHSQEGSHFFNERHPEIFSAHPLLLVEKVPLKKDEKNSRRACWNCGKLVL